MSSSTYQQLQISTAKAEDILLEYYGIKGRAIALPGEFDNNFRIKTQKAGYLLKINRPGADEAMIDFQQKLLTHIHDTDADIQVPELVHDLHNQPTINITDEFGKQRKVRLFTWIDGRLWSSVNPHGEGLLFSLGQQAGKLTNALHNFDHPFAHRHFDWDLGNAGWTIKQFDRFEPNEHKLLSGFGERYMQLQPKLATMRKGVVHNDINDNNILVSSNLAQPEVEAIIDFGDAIYTEQINDLAIALAYAVMDKPDPLRAAIPVVKGYHSQWPLLEEELELLYVLVAMRLVTSVVKAAMNREVEEDNRYLQVSEQAAWDLLQKWQGVNEQIAYFTFRDACGFAAHPSFPVFLDWTSQNRLSLETLFPTLKCNQITPVDLGVGSTWLGNKSEFDDTAHFALKIKQLQTQHPGTIVAGGYLETRPFYSTNQFKKEGNNGPEYRSNHLGTDYWVDEGTPVHAMYDARVYAIHNNDLPKDYGPTLMLEHTYADDKIFYSLYGHLSHSSLELLKTGQTIKKGELIAYVGGSHENGGWSPHLHFQLMLDMLGNKTDFPGVAFPHETGVWKQVCPGPHLIFAAHRPPDQPSERRDAILAYRKKHLGKNLSLSFEEPLLMVRGEGAYLMDETGRKYLDTVNNVAHVGHEHPRVVKAGQAQMALLNSNTRYLHPNITRFTAELLSTFPPELEVVYFVNSGSEANELALRMAKTFTNQKDIIAVEAGYHGNTGACIDVSSYKFDGEGGEGAPEHTHIVPLPDAFRGKYRGNNTGTLYASHVQEQINTIRSNGRNVAAFICESNISCGGQIELPENYLKQACDYVHKAGGLYIADEVQTGCGRVGKTFWAFQLHDVIPDIVTIGKPIGNGHPLAAVVCTRKVADAFANGMEYFNTFGGNPVSCAIGLEVLSVIKDEKLLENALKVGSFLKRELLKLKSDFPIIGDVRGEGLFLGFELNGPNQLPLKDQADYLANRMRNLGILMSTDGPDHNVLKIKPPLVFSEENAEELIMRLKQVFQEDFMQMAGSQTEIS